MAVEKRLAAQGAGHVGIGVVVVHDACDEELHKFVHAAIFAEVGHGTEIVAALQATYDAHDRVVIISDMQAFAHPGVGAPLGFGGGRGYQPVSVSEAVPACVPMFGINTSGHAPAAIDTSKPHRYEVGGVSDQVFTMVDLLSRGRDAGWPWESGA
ncbi:hypothetical protein ACWERF_19150 [Streptomyces griseoluteus]